MGISLFDLDSIFTFQTKQYGLLEALPAGADKAFSTIANYVKNLKLLFNKETGAYKEVGGFIAIGKMFNPTWDWFDFWQLTAILSLILAFMNVLPIPALDGGHALFCIYEMITGRKPSDKFLENAQVVGMVILFSLLIFANGNDILKLFR
jgi:regulator of sigma E protease